MLSIKKLENTSLPRRKARAKKKVGKRLKHAAEHDIGALAPSSSVPPAALRMARILQYLDRNSRLFHRKNTEFNVGICNLHSSHEAEYFNRQMAKTKKVHQNQFRFNPMRALKGVQEAALSSSRATRDQGGRNAEPCRGGRSVDRRVYW